jgi:F0F1-type ATP synthase assembly protein I
MDVILYLIAGIAIGAFIGWLLCKSTGRTEWEKKNAVFNNRSIE